MAAKENNSTGLKSSVLLKNAVQDVERLLAHASEFGIKVSEKHIKVIVEAKNREQTGNWTEQEEIDFWISFQVLSILVMPVSVDSLRATSESNIEASGIWQKFFKGKSLVRRSVRWYAFFTLVTMIVLIALIVYTMKGNSLLTEISKDNIRMVEIENRMQALALITSNNQDDRTAMMEQNSLEIENDEIATKSESAVHLLGDWLELTYNFWSRGHNDIEASLKSENTEPTDGPPAFDSSVGISKNIVIIQQSKSLLIILNQYILPLLAGLFGGFAFVLRRIRTEIKEMTFTSASNVNFGLRIHLGALAGLIVGLLWGDFESSSFGLATESVTSLTVALLAGYSVEFLFRSLDSIIGITSKKVHSEAAPIEEPKKTE